MSLRVGRKPKNSENKGHSHEHAENTSNTNLSSGSTQGPWSFKTATLLCFWGIKMLLIVLLFINANYPCMYLYPLCGFSKLVLDCTHIYSSILCLVGTQSPARMVWRAETSLRTWEAHWESRADCTPSVWSLLLCGRMSCSHHSWPCTACSALSFPPARSPCSGDSRRPGSHWCTRQGGSHLCKICKKCEKDIN